LSRTTRGFLGSASTTTLRQCRRLKAWSAGHGQVSPYSCGSPSCGRSMEIASPRPKPMYPGGSLSLRSMQSGRKVSDRTLLSHGGRRKKIVCSAWKPNPLSPRENMRDTTAGAAASESASVTLVSTWSKIDRAADPLRSTTNSPPTLRVMAGPRSVFSSRCVHSAHVRSNGGVFGISVRLSSAQDRPPVASATSVTSKAVAARRSR